MKHVAIIMDGNGRWAKKRFRPRIWGHVRGSSVVSEIVQAADDIGVKALTMYAFSSENWSRPVDEVSILFKLLKKFLLKERERLIKNNVHFKVIGEINGLPEDTVALIKETEAITSKATGLKLTFAFSYGGRAEIMRAVNQFQIQNPSKLMTEEDLSSMLYRPETGDVDLMIRTGGEQRVSNFLLWQMAYAEFYFTQTKWPEFTAEEFKQILNHVANRERRFGNVSAQLSLQTTMKQAETNKSVFTQGVFS